MIDATYLGGSLYLPEPVMSAPSWDGEAAWQREDDRAYGRVGVPGRRHHVDGRDDRRSPQAKPERLAITKERALPASTRLKAAAIRDGFEFEDAKCAVPELEQHLSALMRSATRHAWCPDGTAERRAGFTTNPRRNTRVRCHLRRA